MEILFERLKKFGDSVAFIEDKQEYTFSGFLHDVEQASMEIRTQIFPDQKIMIWDFTPGYKQMILLFAFARVNAVVVPNNVATRLFKGIEKKQLRCFNSEVFFIDNIQNAFTAELKYRNAPGLVIATSGTGASPRSVVLDFGMLCEKYLKLRTRFKSVLTFSLEHISGIETLLSILTPGGTVILVPSRSPEAMAEAMHLHEADLLACTPTFMIQLYLKNLLNKKTLSGLKIINSGGEPLKELWYEKFHQTLPDVEMRQAFGTTESTNFKTITHPDNIKKFKPGILNQDYLIINHILYLRNRRFMLGNWEDKKVDRNDWIETTDIVEVDADGFIEVVDRTEKMISVGGNKVNPEEVESVLFQLPFVKYAKVYGEDNILLGQIVVADVICDPGDMDEMRQQIRNLSKYMLDDYKIPLKINFKEVLPMTPRFKNSTI